MKFAQSCVIATMAAVSSAADISIILTILDTDLLNNAIFQKTFLQNLQKDNQNTASDCMVGYDTLLTTYSQLVTNLNSDANYYAGLKEKGNGQGSEYGYALDKVESYIDMLTVSTNLYNECDIEYYAQAVSKATSNVSGFCGQAFNTYFRLQESTLYDEMEVAFTAEDPTTSATLLAGFVKDFLMAEIPDKAAAGYYQEVGSFI